jgi:hypothetical protein
MLNVIMLSVIKLNVTYEPFMINAIMLSDIILNVVVLIVVAPHQPSLFWLSSCCQPPLGCVTAILFERLIS